MTSMRALLAALALTAFFACEPAKQADQEPVVGPSADLVVGKLDGGDVTVGDIDEWIKDQLFSQATRGKNPMKVYEVRTRALEQMANERAMERAATQAGKDKDALLKEEVERRASVTDEEVQKYYDDHKDRFRNLPFEKVSPAVKRQLLAQKQVAAMQEYTKSLRETIGFESKLEPPRFEIAASGPTQGPADAPITLVEFSDYECPFCKASEAVVKQVLKRYPTQVKLVFKNYPLPTHPKARPAAEAALCAAEQGKFWEFHAKLFEKAPQIAPEQLAGIATEAGLDAAKLQECITAKRSSAQIDADLEVGKSAGVAGTPAFYVNGVPISGGRTVDEFAKAIDAELARLGLPVPPPPVKPAPTAQAPMQAPPAAAQPAPMAQPAPAAPSAAPAPAAPNAAPAAPPTADDGHGH